MDNSIVLGIDLGANSVGTALVDPKGQKIIFTGVRVFPLAGATDPGDFERGKDKPANQDRRDARQQRRQTDRRRRRLKGVYKLLQRYSWLPAGDALDVIPVLDRRLQKKHAQTGILPYFLRTRALDHELDDHELDRAIYHLAQRRGFLSNRKTKPKEDEEKGKVYKGIGDLQCIKEAIPGLP